MFKKSNLKKLTRIGLVCFTLCILLGAIGSFADPVSDTTVVGEIFNVFTLVGNWITEALSDLVVIFYSAETGLTFLGLLSLISLGISVILLIVWIIQSFLRFRS